MSQEKWADRNKDKFEEIAGDQCPRILMSMSEAANLVNKLSVHINFLLKELDAEYQRGREDESED